MIFPLRTVPRLCLTAMLFIGIYASASAQEPPIIPADNAAAASPAPDGAAAQRVDAESTDHAANDNLLKLIQYAGYAIYPLILLASFLLLVFIFERAISLRKGRVIPGPFVKRFLQQVSDGEIDRDEALELCYENKSPTAEVFAAAVKKWGRSSVEVEQAIIDSGERVTNGLRRFLRMLNGIATVSPLLGLLGTVTGMITAFASFGADKPDANLLAGGISQALLTTAAGLCVAIPALIAYLFFVGKVDNLIIQIDALGQRLVNAIAADGVPDPQPRARSSSGKKKSRSTSGDDARGAA